MLPLLHPGARWTFVGGKGGVGKTTTAAALAVTLADEGDRVLTLSVDPAHSLSDALGVPLGPDPAAVPAVPRLEAMQIDPAVERARFLETRRGSLLTIIERGTYLDTADVDGMVELAIPGIDEMAALFRLIELAEDPSRRLVIDTAPTGHTLRLLDLAEVARGWLAALEAMEEKHRIVAEALGRGAVADDEADRLIREIGDDLTSLSATLRDPDRTRFLLVTNPEPVVLAETRRYRQALEDRGIALAGILVNRSDAEVSGSALGAGVLFVPPLPGPLVGAAQLRAFAAAASPHPTAPSRGSAAPRAGVRAGGPIAPPLDRRLYIVGGKGGVGKSTAAAAIAAEIAASPRRTGDVLLLGIDPAGSLGDILGIEIGDEPAPVPGAPELRVRQLDAPAAWDEFRAGYREHAERLFAGLVSGGLSASADQRVVERLVDLAPPGIDELVALLEVIDLTEDRPYDALVLDTAPTGHLLRLLEMPEVALEWAHAILRLLLKYREVVGLGDLARRVLELSRSLRTLRGQLGDPRHTWLVVVALPESLSVPETARLARRLGELRVPASAVLVNRVLSDGGVRPEIAGPAAELVDSVAGLPVIAAPDLEDGPIGVAELREYLHGWREMEM